MKEDPRIVWVFTETGRKELMTIYAVPEVLEMVRGEHPSYILYPPREDEEEVRVKRWRGLAVGFKVLEFRPLSRRDLWKPVYPMGKNVVANLKAISLELASRVCMELNEPVIAVLSEDGVCVYVFEREPVYFYTTKPVATSGSLVVAKALGSAGDEVAVAFRVEVYLDDATHVDVGLVRVIAHGKFYAPGFYSLQTDAVVFRNVKEKVLRLPDGRELTLEPGTWYVGGR